MTIEILASSDPLDYEIADCPDWPPAPVPKTTGRPLAYFVVLPCWIFHKVDADPWPSLLHGHHNERPLKLDAITGFIYNIRNRKHVQSLRRKPLLAVQQQLLMSKDLRERARSLLTRGMLI
jgi:hypothetical protein